MGLYDRFVEAGLMGTTEARAVLLAALVVVPATMGPAAEPPIAPGFLFGFAKKVITPEIGPRPVYLAGFDQNRKATAAHDDLWARAVAVSDGTQRIAIVSVDLIGVFHADVENVRERLQRAVPGAVLIVSSTHNHDGPEGC